MIRSELVDRIAAQNPHLRIRDAEAVVSAILARMTEALTAGGRVELRDFGTFGLKHREAREGRNPRTGTKVDVPAKADVVFRPGRAMRARLTQAQPSGLAPRTAEQKLATGAEPS